MHENTLNFVTFLLFMLCGKIRRGPDILPEPQTVNLYAETIDLHFFN